VQENVAERPDSETAAAATAEANGAPNGQAHDETPVEPPQGGYKTKRGRAKSGGKGSAAATVAEALKLPKMKLATRKLKEIKVKNRVREDLGDIAGLADTIRTVGLLQPIVVNEETNELVAGERRFRALETLGVEETEVRLFTGDKSEAGMAEAIENIARKPFTPTESWNAAQVLEKALRKRFAAEGKGGGKHFPKGMGERDVLLGKYVGMDASTFGKLRQIMEAHQKAPKKFQKVVDDLEQTGSIDRSFKVVRQATQKSRPQVKESPADLRRRQCEETDKALGALVRLMDEIKIGSKYRATVDAIRKDIMAAMPKVVD
jgi:ParB family transcriptional regulator, chromosome partitioning protein